MSTLYSPAFVDAVKDAPLAGIIGRYTRLRREGRFLRGLCPFHNEKTPSFTVYDSPGDRRFKCFGCGEHGDAFDFLQRIGGMDFRSAVETMAAEAGLTSPRAEAGRSAPKLPPPVPVEDIEVSTVPKSSALRGSALVDQIWDMADPFHRSPAEAHIIWRCGQAPRSPDLRFLPATAKHPHPTMVGLITDFATGEPLSLHFTLLGPDGIGKANVPTQRRLLAGHSKSGGVIRLTPDADTTLGLGLAEGLETAISCMVSGWRPVWAAIDAGNMAALPVVEGIECLTVFADNDTHGRGREAASALADRWIAAGREASVVEAPVVGSDWNDLTGKAA